MTDRGAPADDPFDADARGLGAESIECSDETAHLLKPLLVNEFGQWQREHRGTIDAYAEALGVRGS